jgi:hypothetical protein
MQQAEGVSEPVEIQHPVNAVWAANSKFPYAILQVPREGSAEFGAELLQQVDQYQDFSARS